MFSYKNGNSKNTRFILRLRNLLRLSDQADLVPRLSNGIRIIPTYIPLIIESEDMEPIKY